MKKRKATKREDKLPNRLLLATSFEFISPHPVEECAYRLHEMNLTKSGFLLPEIATYVFSDEPNEYYFYIRQLERTPFKWTIGNIAASDEALTIISGQVGVTRNELFYMVSMYLIGLIGFAVFAAIPVRWIVPWIGWTGIFTFMSFINLRYARFNILQTLKRNLEITTD